MNKKIIFGVCILIILIIIFLFLPKSQEEQIKSEIDKANYCELNSDCVDAGGKCPFGCYVFVNKNEVEKISKLIEEYYSKCVYGCVGNISAYCENRKCVEANPLTI